jgi:hypothetical protein
VRDELQKQVDTLRKIYFLCQNLRGEGREHIRQLDEAILRLPERYVPQLTEAVKKDIEWAKSEFGCRLTNDQINTVVASLLSQGAISTNIGIPKWFIDAAWFANYSRAFPRWPHIPNHAFVYFQNRLEEDSPYSLFVTDEMIFRDITLLWRQITAILSDGKNPKTREREKQHNLSSYMRTIVGTTYHFVEAYLNGIAYDCFHIHHNRLPIEDHDLLCEWDSERKRERFVSFNTKAQKYPVLCAKYQGNEITFAPDADMNYLTNEGKELRDALTHPSPYRNHDSNNPSKSQLIMGLTSDQIKRLLGAATAYVYRVEITLRRDPSQSIPWLSMADIFERPKVG